MTQQPPTPDPPQVVLTFLESIGRRSEAELYLRLFTELPKESFALIVADTQVTTGAIGSLVEQLRFLAELGLFAPVVLGLFRPNRAHSDARRLAQRLPLSGLKPCIHSAEETGLGEALASELRHESIPIVYFNAASAVEIHTRVQRLGRLARALDSRKVVILRPQGGLRILGAEGEPAVDSRTDADLLTGGGGLSVVNLREDFEALKGDGRLLSEDAALLAHVSELFTNFPDKRTKVSVTSPLNLLEELFTVRGAGTLITSGAKIERFTEYSAVDVGRLRQLLESTFGRPLVPGFFERPLLDVYLESEYRGVAVVEPATLAPFLTKFAVDRLAQGDGIGRDLWAAMTRQHPRLYWRAKASNPITAWYMKHCHGMIKQGPWHVYWRGLAASEIAGAVDDACARPEDFGGTPG